MNKNIFNIVKKLSSLRPPLRISGISYDDKYKDGTLLNYFIKQNKHIFTDPDARSVSNVM